MSSPSRARAAAGPLHRPRFALLARLALPAFPLGACGGPATKGDDSAATADSGGAVDPSCADQPVVTWANFGAGFLREQCQSCHAASAPDRRGAPEGVSFGAEEDAQRHRDRIAARSLGEAPTMPPEGGVSEDDRALLSIWLRCDPAMQAGADGWPE